MRCPKCHYISFDSGDRCRNCGYDFSLAVETPENTLGLKADSEIPAPPDDFSLPDLDRAETPAAAGRQPADKTWRPADSGTGLDLPLFPGDDRPLVTPPAVPRAPLAVRRATPAVPRLRTPNPEPPERVLPLEPAGRSAPPAPLPARPGGGEALADDTAPAGARLGAAVVDAILLAAIDLAVLIMTLRLAGLERDELGMLPIVPFLAFLALLNGGYVVLFTATVGQTLGKMAFGLRVIDAADDTGGPPGVGQTALRALASVLSLAPLGLGYLPALLGGDRRAFHDRLTDTRVVSNRS